MPICRLSDVQNYNGRVSTYNCNVHSAIKMYYIINHHTASFYSRNNNWCYNRVTMVIQQDNGSSKFMEGSRRTPGIWYCLSECRLLRIVSDLFRYIDECGMHSNLDCRRVKPDPVSYFISSSRCPAILSIFLPFLGCLGVFSYQSKGIHLASS